MINLIFAALLMVLVLWISKKFYFPTEMAEHPERYPTPIERISKRELETVLKNLKRWKESGKISREEYDNLTDLCIQEIRSMEEKN